MRREAEENVFLNYVQAVSSLGAIRSETGEATPGDVACGFPPPHVSLCDFVRSFSSVTE